MIEPDQASGAGERFLLWLEQLRDSDPRFAEAAVLYPWFTCEWQSAVYLLTGSERVWDEVGADVMAMRSIAPAVSLMERISGSRTEQDQLVLRWAANFWDDFHRGSPRLPYAFDAFHFHRWITALHIRQQLTPALTITPAVLKERGRPMNGLNFQRVCAWSGIATALLFFGAFVSAGFIPPLSPHSSAEVISTFYRQHATGIRIGGVLMLLSGMFYAAFTGVVSVQMKRIPDSHAAAHYVQLCAGAFACLTFLVPAMLFEVTAFRPGRPADQTQLLNDPAVAEPST